MDKKTKLKIIIIILLGIIIIFSSYIIFIKGQTTIVTESYTETSTKIPEEFDNFKIAVFSDLCIQDEEDVEAFKTTVEKINKNNYDLVLFAGDLYYNGIYDLEEVQNCFATIKANYGKFAVLGEKDLTTNTDTTNMLMVGGFEVLKDQAIPIYYNGASILLVGLESEINIDSIVDSKYAGYYKIVLVHQPDYYLASNDGDNDIDLQLSGHSYGGYTYLPLINISHKRIGATTYYHGKSSVGDSTIIITNGINNEPDYTFRLFCQPDIVSIKLKSKADS